MANFRNPGVDFAARQLAAFTRLCTLGHFDLEFFRLCQIVTCDPETSGRDLLDRAVARISVRIERIAGGVFAAFAGVALAADTIHGDGQ